MIIRRWRAEGGVTNFGDELNTFLWSRLLPEKFATLPGTFYGIGTVLHSGSEPGIIFGTGAGYSPPPRIDDRWKVYFVRGPQSAALLGGVPWIMDPAVLVRHFFKATSYREFACSFMPRWDSVSPELIDGCRQANIHLIDPRDPVEKVMAEIALSDLLLTEALHGAVVADTLRVPWVSIYATRGHEFKWIDYCGSLEQVWNPIDAVQFSLSWARDFAVPQLSAQSILDRRCAAVDRALGVFLADIEAGRFA